MAFEKRNASTQNRGGGSAAVTTHINLTTIEKKSSGVKDGGENKRPGTTHEVGKWKKGHGQTG